MVSTFHTFFSGFIHFWHYLSVFIALIIFVLNDKRFVLLHWNDKSFQIFSVIFFIHNWSLKNNLPPPFFSPNFSVFCFLFLFWGFARKVSLKWCNVLQDNQGVDLYCYYKGEISVLCLVLPLLSFFLNIYHFLAWRILLCLLTHQHTINGHEYDAGSLSWV